MTSMIRALGLRTLLLLALAAAFAFAAFVLAATASQFSSRARERDRHHDAEQIMVALLAASANEDALTPQALEAITRSGVVKGVLFKRPGVEWAAGQTRGPAMGQGVGERMVTVWVAPPRHESALLERGLLLSFVLTSFVFLVFTYVLVTFWLVRPLEHLTFASERIARGTEDVTLPIGGARESIRLGEAIASMAARLRADKRALEARLLALEEKTRALNEAQEQLIRSEKLASVGRLAAGVAHEIGNPLAAILGLVEILRGGDLSAEENQEFLARAQSETERIQRIIRDMLDFARRDQPASGPSQAITSEIIDVSLVVGDAVRLVEGHAKKRDLKISFQTETAFRAVASSDRLTQVIVNLLFNAVDASPAHSEIRIHLEATDEHLLVHVDDDGEGIAPEVRATLFEPFVTTKPTGQGTGLGLAVSLTLVEQMGGAIEVHARAPRGTRFTVLLRSAG